MDQFNRQASIILGGKEYDSSVFSFEFNVDFDDSPDLNHAEMTIFNLSDDTINSTKTGVEIIINAGYEGDTGCLFVGTVYDVKTTNYDVDRKTTIKAIDSADQRGESRINRTYAAGAKADQIISDLCGIAGVPIGELSLPENIQYRNGKNVNGRVLTLLKLIAIDCGAKFHILQGLAYFRGKKDGKDAGFLFNQKTGLIGSPEPFKEEDEDGDITEGYSLKTLLNHRIQPDSEIEIGSISTNGFFRVVSGNHSFTKSEMVTFMEVVQ